MIVNVAVAFDPDPESVAVPSGSPATENSTVPAGVAGPVTTAVTCTGVLVLIAAALAVSVNVVATGVGRLAQFVTRL